MNAEVQVIHTRSLTDNVAPVTEPIHLDMCASKEIRYSILHSQQPIFNVEAGLIAGIVEDRPVMLIVDGNVDRLHGQSIKSYASRHLNVASTVVIEAQESHKTWQQAELICNAAMDCGLGRTAVIIGIGGGVVLDLSGFAASIFRRGIGYFRIPTTLIGQVDVSVGIKQGVNAGRFKNVLGSFYAPLASVNDISLLNTLPALHIAAGFAEIIKMAVISDPVLFELVETYGSELLDSRFQSPASVAQSIMWRAEASMLRELKGNLFETTLQRLVDFGHTFSVAMEIDSGYQLPHGLAVGLDMLISTVIAVNRKICPKSVLERMLAIFKAVKLPLSQQICGAEELHASLAAIRSHRGGDLNLVIPRNIGQPVFVQEISMDELTRALSFLAEVES